MSGNDDLVPVTQSDREGAAHRCGCAAKAKAIRRGEMDHTEFVQGITKYRRLSGKGAA
ncbi:hypothetical protein [Sphingomonas parapaucimobilis]|uniref:Uncharacterized protein n=1 Tax=Sphingomonas parapaucimobilis NBRC 15100 TaxID=1219049 RepID=A0A0A1W9R5_9SPHN|nr:hypothetical protein [Sphingomonas parapaucimobilis]GAM01912.1 hypothetical protein SP5_069_01560 [Sphingomonas parapaucimobilis NBRC 15100]